ncbi:restriction endonuclease subunit S [Proteus mirabilis]|uniref:restriction endonuclease subunit S n=1 Tax=Proteus mirabilis TaxID=584 RepID=UPI001A225E66|nr:restriction endonuclease subunit S [Proteus mirabilis]MBI6378785.1 restriction endonuclease subunit S [Proteus mirabilis]MCL8621104.1 restriction endonuclease subunit S [Proteus mirabilis]MCL8632229.1 restriction endonuclease subunit S [Proteus mirabilis]HBC5067530.1 restriction endonuclease subunit S [Proteus mirabilis]
MVPNGWETRKLSTLGDGSKPAVKAGPFGSAIKKEYYVSSGYKVYGQEQVIADDAFIGDYFIDEEKFQSLKSYSISPGDILISLVGTVGRVLLVPENAVPGIINPRLLRLSLCNSKINGVYIKYFLETEHTKNTLNSWAQGGTMGVLNAEMLKSLNVLVPPLPEQRKIAKILSTWDNAIATTEKLIATSQQQKKALMQQLLTGKKRLVNPETGKVFEGEWENTHLSNIASIKKGKALSAKNLVSGSYPVIAGGKSSPYSHVHFTHENIITVSASGAYAGYVSYHPYKIWASDCSVVTAKPANYLGFIFQWLQLNQIRIYSMQSGGAQPHIYPKDLEVMKLRVPKIEEQQKIASVLTAADKEIELLEAKLAHFKQEKKALMQQLLTGKRRVKVTETEAA